MAAQPSIKNAVELKNGKKRKRAAGPEVEREEAPPKKGTGKLIKLEKSQTDENRTNSQDKSLEGGQTVVKTIVERPKSSSKDAHKQQKPTSTSHPQQSRPNNKQHGKNQNSKQSQGSVPPHLLKKRDQLLPIRKALPIWPQANAIKAALKKNNVLVLTGETGSGKSTQVPQFLVNEPWCTKCIAITQPRRVAAISLARRVAEEMGSFMGSQSPAAKVGYSVRFDNATGPNTKVKFLTEGMLLQEMLRDPAMSQYSAIVVDEVHERSVNVDLILGFLKNLVAGVEKEGDANRKDPLKVVVMSATADVESLVKFFEHGQTPGGADSSVEKGKDDKEVSEQGTVSVKTTSGRVSTCFVEGRQFPVKTIYLPQPTQDWVEAALKIIFQVHYKEPLPGDILVFLTGQDTIEGLEKLVNDYAEGMDRDVPKVSCLWLDIILYSRWPDPLTINTYHTDVREELS